jgi:hypothetical protein
MRLFLTNTAARLATLGILASKLLVDLDWQALHSEVAEWAFGEKVQTSRFQVFSLLHVL